MHDKKEATSQIIGASTNLLGVCLIIITALKVSGFSAAALLDEITAVSSVFFLISCVIAYLSLRRTSRFTGLYRDIADYAFLAGSTLLVISTILLSLDFL